MHALGNVAVFDTESPIPPERFSYALNQRLPEDIVVVKSDEVPFDWHPRYQDNISKIELIYKTSNYHKYFAPYYCFWVSNGEKMQNGLEIYSAFYISAIEEKYLR